MMRLNFIKKKMKGWPAHTIFSLNLFIIIVLIISSSIGYAYQERWVYKFDGAGDVGVEKARGVAYGCDYNIYAAGHTNNFTPAHGDEFTVISLDTTGTVRWRYLYDGPAQGWDWAYSVIYGGDGNIYTAGFSTENLSNYWDFTVISLTPSGDERWIYRRSGAGYNHDEATSLVYGDDGNIYAAGFICNASGGEEFTVVSFDTSGNERWIYQWDGGQPDLTHRATCVQYGTDGNIYISGMGWVNDNGHDFVVISLTPQGEERWVYVYPGSPNTFGWAYSVVYGDDNIYATGFCDCPGIGTARLVVISLNPAGAEQWIYKPSGIGEDAGASSIIFGLDGNIYVAGYGYSGDRDFLVLSLTSDGSERWIYTFDGVSDSDDQARSVVYGTDGKIYASGRSVPGGIYLSTNFTVIALSNAGEFLWKYDYIYTTESCGESFQLVYGLDNNIYAAGTSYNGDPYGFDFTVISLDPQTGIQEESSDKRCVLCSCYPNPFRDVTHLKLQAAKNCGGPRIKNQVGLEIYDATGRLVRTLPINQLTNSQINQLNWDGTDDSGNILPGGVYFVKIISGNTVTIQKVCKLK
jgi:hypothetical protein